MALRNSLIWMVSILAIIHIFAQSRVTTLSISPSYYSSSSSPSLLLLRLRNHQYSRLHPRSLQEELAVDGTTACADCDTSSGHQCVGRTVQDENCDDCVGGGQTFWPCDLVNECWCWDTALPRTAPSSGGSGEVACGGCGAESDTEECVANTNSLIPVEDTECAKCMEGQSFWPCDDPDLCWCWDNTKPKQPPAPASGVPLATDLDPNVPSPCDVFTDDMFDAIAPNATFPYTFEGFCTAIKDYNLHHTEKFAEMGTEEQIRAEIAAFLGNTAHESDDFEAAREYLACGDRKEIDGKVYCKPCNQDQYDFATHNCSVSMVDQNAPFNSYCQPMEPPAGCVCDTITQVEEVGELAGYIDASKVFYGRGAIQLSWNYNYVRLSYALTGKAETFCDDPEQIALSPEYAWGSAIYFWMENQKDGSTCHKEALKGDFGGTLNNINGGLECPAYHGGWHASAIKMRLNRYCHAASELGMPSISSLDGCKGMTDSFEECLADGECPYCEQYADAANNSTNNATEIEADEGSHAPSVVESLGSSTPSASSSMITSGISPTKSPSLTSIPTPVFSGFPSLTGVGNSAESTTPTVTSTLSPSAMEGGGISDLSAIPSLVGNESIVETIAPSVLATEISTTLVPTVTPTGSLLPSYTPTTLKPTMGPCDGDSCPGEMCRSTYGYCGSGPSYCDENPIWTPECGDNINSSSPSSTVLMKDMPTMSPVNLDFVFSVDGATTTPSTSPAAPSVESSFIKPSGGKKPLPTPPKTSPSPTINDKVLLTNSPTVSLLTDTPTQTTDAPTPRPSEKVLSPTDPEATYYCGLDWEDANASCSLRCPSSKSEDCPSDQKCFAFTSCMDSIESPDNSNNNAEKAQNETDKFELTPAPNEVTSSTATDDGCNGKPCPFAGECRSQYGFCGKSFIYCNDVSSWKLECGIVGSDKNGNPIQCDTEVFKCADGDEVYKDPANACEFFPCPDDKGEESAVTFTSFHTPGLSPSQSSPAEMPVLPKPTLPTITNASPFTLPTVNATTATIDLGEIPVATDNAVVVVDETSNITHNRDTPLDNTENGNNSAPSQKTLSSFSADEWLMNSSKMSRDVGYRFVLMTALFVGVLSRLLSMPT